MILLWGCLLADSHERDLKLQTDRQQNALCTQYVPIAAAAMLLCWPNHCWLICIGVAHKHRSGYSALCQDVQPELCLVLLWEWKNQYTSIIGCFDEQQMLSSADELSATQGQHASESVHFFDISLDTSLNMQRCSN